MPKFAMVKIVEYFRHARPFTGSNRDDPDGILWHDIFNAL
jgi:hypothetical protein